MTYNVIINLKDSILLQYKTLNDLTAVNYPELLKSIELNYYFLSYKLNYKYTLKHFVKKEDLILSLMETYENAN